MFSSVKSHVQRQSLFATYSIYFVSLYYHCHDFATLLMVKVLSKLQAHKNHSEEEWNKYLAWMVERAMEGVTHVGRCPNDYPIDKVSEAVLKGLKALTGSERIQQY